MEGETYGGKSTAGSGRRGKRAPNESASYGTFVTPCIVDTCCLFPEMALEVVSRYITMYIWFNGSVVKLIGRGGSGCFAQCKMGRPFSLLILPSSRVARYEVGVQLYVQPQ